MGARLGSPRGLARHTKLRQLNNSYNTLSLNTTKFTRFSIQFIMGLGQQEDTGVTKGAKGVTSTLGNTIGGLTNTVGGVVGAASRGLGETVSGATGGVGKDVGKGVADIGNGVEDGGNRVAQGAKDAGEWKS